MLLNVLKCSLAAVLAIVAMPAAAQTPRPVADAGAACAALAGRHIENGAEIVTARLMPAAASVGMACVVHGRIVSSPTSTITFRTDLPERAAWNRKLMFMGGGGFDGFIMNDITDQMMKALPPGFLVVATDSGHQGRGGFPDAMFDFSWAAHNPSAIRNHAYEANHLVLWATVALSRAYFGEEPTERYISGVSNGGRAGLAAAQRYPKDYHGIVARAPAIMQQGWAANMTALYQHIFATPANWLNAAQVRLYGEAEMAACDGLDGLKDGMLGNVRACTFDAAALACKPGDTGDACLTPGQVETVRMILADKRVDVPLAFGSIGYPGMGRGGALSDWTRFQFGTSFAARDAADFTLIDNIVKNSITDNPNASVMTHDPMKWRAQYLAMSNAIDTVDPDLSGFLAAGGKLIVWYGVGDGCISYARTAQYLDAVRARVGEAAYDRGVRFYSSPSLGHGGTGTGADSFDLFGPIQQWVATGKAPADPVATRKTGDATVARPLCRYPAFPRYKGRGDPAAAASFTCATS